MRKILALVVAASVFWLAPERSLAIQAMTTTGRPGDTSTYAATGTSGWYYVGSTCGAFVTVRAASGTSSSTVKIEQYTDDSTHVRDLTASQDPDISNVDTNGRGFYVPPTGFVRVNVSAWASGTISATIEAKDCQGRQIF